MKNECKKYRNIQEKGEENEKENEKEQSNIFKFLEEGTEHCLGLRNDGVYDAGIFSSSGFHSDWNYK